MYDELVKRLRNCAELHGECALCLYQGNGCDAMPETPLVQAADAVEELSLMAESYKRSMEASDEAANAQPRWIPVTERLPKYGDWVLGIGPKKGYHVCEYRGISHFVYGGDSPWFSAKGRAITVTHWMPLPEPPKEE